MDAYDQDHLERRSVPDLVIQLTYPFKTLLLQFVTIALVSQVYVIELSRIGERCLRMLVGSAHPSLETALALVA